MGTTRNLSVLKPGLEFEIVAESTMNAREEYFSSKKEGRDQGSKKEEEGIGIQTIPIAIVAYSAFYFPKSYHVIHFKLNYKPFVILGLLSG